MLFFDWFLVVFVVAAAGFDLVKNRIPNWLNLAAVAAGVLLNAWTGIPRLVDNLFGFGLRLSILFLPFVFGWLRTEDVKFLAAVDAILGVE